MVSNSLDMELDELIAALERIRRDHANDPEYAELRRAFPKSWPM
jgi:hypothetical protein